MCKYVAATLLYECEMGWPTLRWSSISSSIGTRGKFKRGEHEWSKRREEHTSECWVLVMMQIMTHDAGLCVVTRAQLCVVVLAQRCVVMRAQRRAAWSFPSSPQQQHVYHWCACKQLASYVESGCP